MQRSALTTYTGESLQDTSSVVLDGLQSSNRRQATLSPGRPLWPEYRIRSVAGNQRCLNHFRCRLRWRCKSPPSPYPKRWPSFASSPTACDETKLDEFTALVPTIGEIRLEAEGRVSWSCGREMPVELAGRALGLILQRLVSAAEQAGERVPAVLKFD